MADSSSNPLPQTVIRNLGDRSYDRRKNAALDIEQHIKLLQDSGAEQKVREEQVRLVIRQLGRDFACSTNAHHRKGGLIGLAATATTSRPAHCPTTVALLSPLATGRLLRRLAARKLAHRPELCV